MSPRSSTTSSSRKPVRRRRTASAQARHIVSIVITASESSAFKGPQTFAGPTAEQRANAYLRKLARAHKRSGGFSYDKTYYTVRFSDGTLSKEKIEITNDPRTAHIRKDLWRHQTLEEYPHTVAGISVLDERPGFSGVYMRDPRGGLWPARTVSRRAEHHDDVVGSWLQRPGAVDLRKGNGSKRRAAPARRKA